MDNENTPSELNQGADILKRERIEGGDLIRADRACIGCGFNLYGQPVSKEEHYDLAIVRCPECGVVGALQSYPTMSHWVNRFRAILAAAWILILLGAFVGYTMASMGLSVGAVEIASDELGDQIGAFHAQWVEDQTVLAQEANGINNAADLAESATDESAATPSSTPIVTPSTYTSTTNGITTTVITAADGTTTTSVNGVTMNNWGGGFQYSTITPVWRERHLDESLEASGGLWRSLDREFMILLMPCGIISLASGLFWSVTMLGARRRTVIWVPAIAGLIAGALAITIQTSTGNNIWANDLAGSMAAPLVVPIMVGFQVLIAILGVFIGRKVARLVVLMTLPPQGRVSLSMLWTRDGLEMPKPKMR